MDNNENKERETEVENKSDVDLSKYENNLEDKDSQSDKILEMLDKQDKYITELKAEIKSLKEMNMELALHTTRENVPINAVDALNDAFGKRGE